MLLTHFGYDRNLDIKDEFINDGSVPKQKLDESRAELTPKAIKFLFQVYDQYVNTDTSMLDRQGLEKIFVTNEEGIPWDWQKESVTQLQNIGSESVSKSAWIGLWQKEFLHSTIGGFTLLVKLGYPDTLKSAVSLKKHSVDDILKTSKRNVFSCYVIGA